MFVFVHVDECLPILEKVKGESSHWAILALPKDCCLGEPEVLRLFPGRVLEPCGRAMRPRGPQARLGETGLPILQQY